MDQDERYKVSCDKQENGGAVDDEEDVIGEKRENGKNRTLSFFDFYKSFYIGTLKNVIIAALLRISPKHLF